MKGKGHRKVDKLFTNNCSAQISNTENRIVLVAMLGIKVLGEVGGASQLQRLVSRPYPGRVWVGKPTVISVKKKS